MAKKDLKRSLEDCRQRWILAIKWRSFSYVDYLEDRMEYYQKKIRRKS